MTRREQLAIGAAVHGAVLPFAAALFGAVGAAVIGMPTTWVVVVAAAALLGGIVRMIGGAWIAAALVMAGLVAADAAPWRTAVVILVVHVLQVLGSFMLVVPLRALVALRALMPAAARFVPVQLVCQAVGMLASLLPARSGLPVAVIVGSAAALLFAVLVARMLRTRRSGAFTKAESALGPSVGGHS